ncbi:hypothetical protein [Streptomyces sp. NPDC002922]|uniref:hypothetical protein n=1 Tax=Streptomyces sp. NPDC002922 TaxID=3154439 RepID=UPI0033AC95A9
MEKQVMDFDGGRLHRGGALLDPAHDHRAFERRDDESGHPLAPLLGQALPEK